MYIARTLEFGNVVVGQGYSQGVYSIVAQTLFR